MALKAKKSGVIIVGGGLVKHHTLNANLMRNGADYSVFINTVQRVFLSFSLSSCALALHSLYSHTNHKTFSDEEVFDNDDDDDDNDDGDGGGLIFVVCPM